MHRIYSSHISTCTHSHKIFFLFFLSLSLTNTHMHTGPAKYKDYIMSRRITMTPSWPGSAATLPLARVGLNLLFEVRDRPQFKQVCTYADAQLKHVACISCYSGARLSYFAGARRRAHCVTWGWWSIHFQIPELRKRPFPQIPGFVTCSLAPDIYSISSTMGLISFVLNIKYEVRELDNRHEYCYSTGWKTYSAWHTEHLSQHHIQALLSALFNSNALILISAEPEGAQRSLYDITVFMKCKI